MSVDPALRFWLGWAGTEGALHEAAGDSTLVVLPTRLQVALGFAEEIAVTADPEVAREDGTLLLAHGHPALDHATDAVLGRGDVGVVTLARPGSVPPDAEAILARARDGFPVDHGRIDQDGSLVAGHRPVLRVGALLTHSVSLEDRFGELAEVWVDARTGLELPDAVRDRVAAAGHADADLRTEPPPELASALESVHRLLEDGATVRREALAKEIGDARAEELERIRAYFDAALVTIRKRRESAPAERRHLYDAREEATRGERARRLVEVEEKWRPRTDVRPFRLHLLWVPSLILPVQVRRGPRGYPSVVEWLRAAGGFAPMRCPHCAGAIRPGAPGLVAGKHRLGCESCLVTAPPEEVVPTPARPTVAPVSTPAPASRSTAAAARSTPHAARSASVRPAPPAVRPTASTTRATATGPAPDRRHPAGSDHPALFDLAAPVVDPQRLAAMGEKLALAFWQAVAERNSRRLRRLIAPDSPLAALLTVCGVDVPARIIGLGPAEVSISVTASGAQMYPTLPQVVWGHVQTRRANRPYALRWEPEDGRALVVEVLANQGPVGWRLPGPSPWHDLLAGYVDEPRCELDAVAAILWRTVPPADGVLLAGRCLAAWWRRGDGSRLEHQPAAVLAAALHHQVARRSGGLHTYAEISRLHRVAETAVRAAATAVQKVLQLSRGRCW